MGAACERPTPWPLFTSDLCPTGQLFRPSCDGLPRSPGNPDPQGTGLRGPSAVAAPGTIRGCENTSYNAYADMAILGQSAPGKAVGRDLYPTGHLFRPSWVGLPRLPRNPDPQGTGSPRPSPTTLPSRDRNRESPSYKARAIKGVLGPEVSGTASDRFLYPTGHLFRPSCDGLPSSLENPGPQGTGSPRPSPTVPDTAPPPARSPL